MPEPFDPPPARETWYRKLQGLMPYRVREILLVSSAYDAFALDEDGPLTEQLFSGYSELNLSQAPRITHVPRIEDAMTSLASRRFDLVVTVVRVEDGDAAELARRVRERHGDLPVALLIFDEEDLQQFPRALPPPEIDQTFLWTGDARILIALLKNIEDTRNVEPDTARATVQVILVVEDRLREYSTFLALLYTELLTHAHSLIDDGLNSHHRLMRMRARPRILLARDYEEAHALWERYTQQCMAVVTDLAIVRGGERTKEAGIALVRAIREVDAELPVLVPTRDSSIAAEVAELGGWLADHGSDGYAGRVREFLQVALGFGDFVFRLADGQEIERARSLHELEQKIETVRADSLAYHVGRNDLSRWLRARSMPDLAARMRRMSLSDPEGIEAHRAELVRVVHEARRRVEQGVITDVHASLTSTEGRFVRVGGGSIGGKGRSLAFVNALIVRHGLLERFEGLEIRIPKTVVVGTDEFDWVMAHGGGRARDHEDDRRTIESMVAAELRPELRLDLQAALDALKGPLAVRSSSLLEDSRFIPFAGVFATYMLPNNHSDKWVRLDEVSRALKAVYASTFSRAAGEYVQGTPHALEDEKMAVVVQQVVGEAHGRRFYPVLSGVARSHDPDPAPGCRPEDGVASVVLGLGASLERGGSAVRFCPAAPELRDRPATVAGWLERTQRELLAVDLGRSRLDAGEGPEVSLSSHDLAAAEADGTLAWCGGVISDEDGTLGRDLSVPGPRVVTFDRILDGDEIPLAPALTALLALLRRAVGGEVEIEFSLGIPVEADKRPRLYVLQLRPLRPVMTNAAGSGTLAGSR